MMEYSNDVFEEMRNDLNNNFHNLCEDELFKVDLDTDELYQLYLDSFPDEIKGTYRENAWHDCSACRKFLRKMSGVISIDEELNIHTIFEFNTVKEYQKVMDTLNEYIIRNISDGVYHIRSCFYSSKDEIGVKEDFEEDDDGNIIKHSHFYVNIPFKYCIGGYEVNKKISESILNKRMLYDTLQTIDYDTILLVLKLIMENRLYRGNQWINNLKSLQDLIKEYIKNDSFINDNEGLELWLWYNSAKYGNKVSRLKNTSIGVLLTDLANGMDTESALRKYEEIVNPYNYQRSSSSFNEDMVKRAEEKITELGYMESLQRRFARLDDLDINNVLFINRNISNESNGLFDDLRKEALVKPKSFNNIPVVSFEEFKDNILPNSSEVYLYLDKNLSNNFVSLTTSLNNDAPLMFKWDNAFAWAYKNNITDSSLKERVKKMGGDVEVDLRFSIQWNDIGGYYDENDLDAHCIEPNGNVIMYNNKRSSYTDGWLDIDITHPNQNKIAVENIRFKHKSDMIDGDYLFSVHNYEYRGGTNGFRAEVEFDNRIYSFNYPFKVNHKEEVPVALVNLNNGVFSINKLLDEQGKNLKEWGCKFNTFIPVTCICNSPNMWNENNIGNEHLFFFLKDCVNPTSPNGWFNEFLKNDLREHRKVLEALSDKCKVNEDNSQLSGVGFSRGRKLSCIVKLIKKGNEEIYKIEF